MKRIFILPVILALLATLAQAALVDLNLSYASRYIFRGYDYNANQPTLQPSATFKLGETGLCFNAFGYYNIGNTTTRQLNEIDYTLTYTATLNEALGYSVYYSYYSYPPLSGAQSKTQELFLALTGTQLPLTPTLTAAYDFDQANGSFFTLALKRSFDLPVRLDTGLTLEYDNGQYGSPTGISDCILSCAASLPCGAFTIQPAAYYVVENKNLRGLDNLFWFNLGVAASL